MSSDLTDDSVQNNTSSEEMRKHKDSTSLPGTELMHKVGHKVAKTAKKTHHSAKSAAKYTQHNIKDVAANATAMLEKMTPTSSKRNSGNKKMHEEEVTQATTEDSEHHASPRKQKEGLNKTDVKSSDYFTTRNAPHRGEGIEMEDTDPNDQEGSSAPNPQTQSNQDSQPTFELKNNVTSMEELQPDRLLQNPSIVAVLVAILMATSKLLTNYSHIWDNAVPVHVALTWAALTLVVGVELGRRQAAKEFREYLILQSTMMHRKVRRPPSSSHDDKEDDYPHTERSQDYHEEERHNTFPRIQKFVGKVQRQLYPPTWTTLNPNRKRQRWERNGNVLVSNSMIKSLHGKIPDHRRTSLRNLGVSHEELKLALAEEASLFGLGTVDDPERMIARSLEDDAIEPMCPLRGMDVFLTDSPENNMANHSYLIEHGLRDRPTFIINVLTQWGNVVIYFEMPSWIQSWDNMVEQEDDHEDVIALKRFFNGDDEYRNLRFKCLPVLVDGPGPMRYMAPAKATCTVVSESLPSTWTFHPPKVENGQTILHPCLELESDLMANRTMRSIAALVKRYMVSMVGDVAVLIEKPWGQEEEEPRACIGMCRFDRIDVKTCPEMPHRAEDGETSEERDMLRASLMMGRPVQ